MDLSKINKISRLENFLPTKKLMELDIGRDYKITAMKKADTKFGSQIIVGLDNEFSVFLPTRISKALKNNPEQFQYMFEASAEDRLLICYLGGKYNECEFSCL